MQHTPGPWHLAEGLYIASDTHGYVPIRTPFRSDAFRGPEGSPTRSVTTDAELYANAKLMAAAPELLEACIQARAAMPDGWFADDCGVSEVVKLLNAAIAKATA